MRGNIRDSGWVRPTVVVHIQLQSVSPGIWHVVSQRSQPDSPSDSRRITVIACLWSLTSSWPHNYRMASHSINERHRRCCTIRTRVRIHAQISIERHVQIRRELLARLSTTARRIRRQSKRRVRFCSLNKPNDGTRSMSK